MGGYDVAAISNFDRCGSGSVELVDHSPRIPSVLGRTYKAAAWIVKARIRLYFRQGKIADKRILFGQIAEGIRLSTLPLSQYCGGFGKTNRAYNPALCLHLCNSIRLRIRRPAQRRVGHDDLERTLQASKPMQIQQRALRTEQREGRSKTILAILAGANSGYANAAATPLMAAPSPMTIAQIAVLSPFSIP